MPRLAGLVLAAAVAAAVLASVASGALFFLFKPTAATPGELVTVRLGGTPASFTAAQRLKPYGRPIRMYLVPNRLADAVRSRFDPRLQFIGQIVPDRKGRGILTFDLPPLDTDEYAVAAWCPGCAATSGGRKFFTLPVDADVASRYRPLMLLHVALPSARERCPVTIPRGGKPAPATERSPSWHGNGQLWTTLSLDGVYRAAPDNRGWEGDPPGSIANKLYWFARSGSSLRLAGKRLDAEAPPLVVHKVNRGSASFWNGPTWATPVTFPGEGCWRLTARLGDVSLTFVVQVLRS